MTQANWILELLCVPGCSLDLVKIWKNAKFKGQIVSGGISKDNFNVIRLYVKAIINGGHSCKH